MRRFLLTGALAFTLLLSIAGCDTKNTASRLSVEQYGTIPGYSQYYSADATGRVNGFHDKKTDTIEDTARNIKKNTKDAALGIQKSAKDTARDIQKDLNNVKGNIR